eukprot:357787-Alexandrium_andersonii.AAC.1
MPARPKRRHTGPRCCSRKPLTPAPPALLVRWPPFPKLAEFCGGPPDWRGPVSYTHLTLPTICSV